MKKIRRDTSIARKVWKSFYGDIPKDEKGRSYEIHHIDGNSANNSIENLACVSIEDHFNIHFIKGELGAAKLILDRLRSQKDLDIKTKWVCKGSIEQLVSIKKLDWYLKNGWSLGMVTTKGEGNPMHKINGRKPPTLNKIWLTKEKNDILINKSDSQIYLDSGWQKGRSRISGDMNKKTFLGRLGKLHPKSKRVCKIETTTHKVLEVYNGIREAVRSLDKKTTNISSACRSYADFNSGILNMPKSAGGYYWKYND